MTNPTTFNPNSWDDVCSEMCMECAPEPDGFEDPPVGLVARYIKEYPHFADDLIDFAAACRSERALLKKYPPPEVTQEQLDADAKRAMILARKITRKVRQQKAKVL